MGMGGGCEGVEYGGLGSLDGSFWIEVDRHW